MELEFKGTKGSWSIEEKGASILDNTGKSLVCWYGVATSTFWKDEEELKANSKLLAAAPELIEALQEMVKMWEALSVSLPPIKDEEAYLKSLKAIEKALQ